MRINDFLQGISLESGEEGRFYAEGSAVKFARAYGAMSDVAADAASWRLVQACGVKLADGRFISSPQVAVIVAAFLNGEEEVSDKLLQDIETEAERVYAETAQTAPC